jgi:hypothetical protein
VPGGGGFDRAGSFVMLRRKHRFRNRPAETDELRIESPRVLRDRPVAPCPPTLEWFGAGCCTAEWPMRRPSVSLVAVPGAVGEGIISAARLLT